MFKRIKRHIKKAEAAALVSGFLEFHAKVGIFKYDAGSVGRSLVDKVWITLSEFLSENHVEYPDRVSVAAAAFVAGIDRYDDEYMPRVCMIISLGKLLQDVTLSCEPGSLNDLDDAMLESAVDRLVENCMEIASGTSALKPPYGDVKYTAYYWDEWYARYKIAAGATNGILATNEQGISLLDSMDHAPLNEACDRGQCPEHLGITFAVSFGSGDVKD